MKRKAFTFIELIIAVTVIGILAAVITPKFKDFINQAKKSSELATAAAVSSALKRIEGEWSITDGDFDWDNDKVIDDIKSELSKDGYPYRLDKNGKTFGAVLKGAGDDGFTLKVPPTAKNNIVYSIFTGKASDPKNGVSFTKESGYDFDIPGKPDKNDFWLYVIETNATKNGCFIEGNGIEKKEISSGDFILVDVKGKKLEDFSKEDLGISFQIKCD